MGRGPQTVKPFCDWGLLISRLRATGMTYAQILKDADLDTSINSLIAYVDGRAREPTYATGRKLLELAESKDIKPERRRD